VKAFAFVSFYQIKNKTQAGSPRSVYLPFFLCHALEKRQSL
jgi:hypothetical protein